MKAIIGSGVFQDQDPSFLWSVIRHLDKEAFRRIYLPYYAKNMHVKAIHGIELPYPDLNLIYRWDWQLSPERLNEKRRIISDLDRIEAKLRDHIRKL